MHILLGLIMGIVYAAAPGPVNVETLRRGMKSGIIDSLAVQTGSSVGRIIYALLALFGAGLLLRGATMQLTLGVFGMTVLFYLGITSIRDWRGLIDHAGKTTENVDSPIHAFWTGAILSLANPLAIVFWLSIGSRVTHEPGLDGATFLLGFFAGCMIVSLFMATLASYWQTRLTAKVALTISWACGLVLIGFGFRLGYTIGTTFHFW